MEFVFVGGYFTLLPPDTDTHTCIVSERQWKQHCLRHVLSVAGFGVEQGKKKNFLVKVGMQSIPHNGTLLQLLQLLVLGQDNEMTACGVEGGSSSTPISLLCTVGPQ